MPERAHDAERHTREVRVRVSDEYFRRIPIVPQQRQRRGEEWQRQKNAKQVRAGGHRLRGRIVR